MYASKTIISFIRTVESGTQAAAAQSLGISAAAVGQSLTRLESSLGVKLFKRTTRELTLTDEGRLLYQRARAPVQALDEINHVFDEQKNIASGEIRVSCTRKLSETIVLNLIAEFSQQHPHVTFSIDSNDAPVNIQRDNVDVVFRIGALQQQNIIARNIGENPLGVYCSPAYKDRHGIPETIDDLSRHNCLQYIFPGNQLKWVWTFQDKQEVRARTEGTMSFNDPMPLVQACRKGLGLIQTDQLSVQTFLTDGSLISVLDEFRPAPFSINLCYATREHLPLRVRRFVDFVVDKSQAAYFLV